MGYASEPRTRRWLISPDDHSDRAPPNRLICGRDEGTHDEAQGALISTLSQSPGPPGKRTKRLPGGRGAMSHSKLARCDGRLSGS